MVLQWSRCDSANRRCAYASAAASCRGGHRDIMRYRADTTATGRRTCTQTRRSGAQHFGVGIARARVSKSARPKAGHAMRLRLLRSATGARAVRQPPAQKARPTDKQVLAADVRAERAHARRKHASPDTRRAPEAAAEPSGVERSMFGFGNALTPARDAAATRTHARARPPPPRTPDADAARARRALKSARRTRTPPAPNARSDDGRTRTRARAAFARRREQARARRLRTA